MKSKDFYSGSDQSQIRFRREKPQPKNKFNWGRYLYITLLILLIAAGGYYLFSQLLFIQGEGRVVAGETIVRAPSDINIFKMAVSEEDQVRKGDTLFSYRLADWKSRIDSLRRLSENRAEINDDLASTEENIRLKQQELRGIGKKLDFLSNQKKQIEKGIKLDVTDLSQLQRVELSIVNLEADKALIRQELNNLYTRRQRLSNTLSPIQRIENSETTYFSHNNQVYLSPVKGKVDQIFKQASEIAFRSENIVSILTSDLQNRKIVVRALFNQEHVKQLQPGDFMNVEFANGISSEGIIIDRYTMRSDFAPSNVRQDILLDNFIIVEMEPRYPKDRKLWEENRHINVTVSKFVNLSEKL